MQAVPSRHGPGGVCLITGELTRYGKAMQSCMGLKMPPGSALSWMMGVLVAHNINEAIKGVMANPKLEWVWLMGDDHTFPPDVLLNLLDREVDVVAPLCLNRAPPMDPVIIDMGASPPRLRYLEDMPASGLYKLGPNEVCGDAGLLVRRHILEKIGYPWHQLKKSGGHNAEDREFIARVKDAGFDVYVDLDNPIGHIAAVEFIPVKVGDHWEVRINCGGSHVCDLGTMNRSAAALKLAS